MLGLGTIGARFSNGEVLHAIVQAEQFFDVIHYPEIFEADEEPVRRCLGAAEAQDTSFPIVPSGLGLIFIDFPHKRIYCHLSNEASVDTFFATRVLSSKFVRKAADLGHAKLVSHAMGRVDLTGLHLDSALDLIESPRSRECVAGLRRVDWLTADVNIDFAGWEIIHRPQTGSGLGHLTSDLRSLGCTVITDHPDWLAWELETPR